jgi:hypothetical protein
MPRKTILRVFLLINRFYRVFMRFPTAGKSGVQASRKLKIGNNYISRCVKFSQSLLLSVAERALDHGR